MIVSHIEHHAVCGLAHCKGEGKVFSGHTMKEYRGIAAFIRNLSGRWMWVVIFMPRPLYPQGRSLVPIQYKAGLAEEPAWMFWIREKSFATARI
jgi:hypothetical protein